MGLRPIGNAMVHVQDMMPAARSILVTIGPQFRVTDALALMERNGIGFQVVCGWKHRVVGIITEAEIRRRLPVIHADARAFEVMRRDVISCVPDDRLEQIWSIMKMAGASRLPVLDRARRPIGVLAATEVSRVLQAVPTESGTA
jgi:CBS domain-containing protein